MAEGGGGEQAAQQVERLGADRALPRPLGLAVPAGPALGGPCFYLAQQARVDREDLVHRGAELGAEVVVAVVAVAAAGIVGERLVVGDIAGGLLQVGGEAPSLQNLGEDVGDPLAGDVGAADLGDRVVAVADEHSLVEFRGALPLGAVEGPPTRRHLGRELLQIEPPHGPGIPRIAGKKRPLDGLRQVDQSEHGPVEIGEVRGKKRLLLRGESTRPGNASADPSCAVGGVGQGSNTPIRHRRVTSRARRLDRADCLGFPGRYEASVDRSGCGCRGRRAGAGGCRGDGEAGAAHRARSSRWGTASSRARVVGATALRRRTVAIAR